MSKTGKAVRLIAGNLAVLLLILMTLNFVAAVILEVQFAFRKGFFPTDERVLLPNYSDKAWAKIIRDEFRDLRTEYVPYVVWSRRPYQGEATTVNGEGDRVHAETTDSPLGVVRFFGGSSTWGSGEDDEGTLPARFNALYPDYKVHNHGESGFYSRPELARLTNLVNQGAAMDLVVFYDGGNDTGSLCRTDVELNGSTRAEKIRRRVHPSSELVNTLFGALLEVVNGKFFKRHTTRTQVSGWRCDDAPAYTEEIARTMVNNWRLAHAAAKVGGGDFVAVLQPMASIGEPRIDHLGMTRPTEPDAYARVYAHVRRIVAADPEIDWMYDFSRAYDGDEYIFIDGVHVMRNGHDIMAARIQEVVDPLLEIQRRPGNSNGTAR
ncbi:MAG: hypothetical protein VCB99_00190 [Myxococcota bacterium]